MRRNRRGFKGDEIRSIINRVASCCIAFPRCRHIYRNTIRLPSLLSSLAVAIIMTARDDAFIDFIGICYGKAPSLLLRTTIMVKLLNIESLISNKKSSPNQFQIYRLRRSHPAESSSWGRRSISQRRLKGKSIARPHRHAIQCSGLSRNRYYDFGDDGNG